MRRASLGVLFYTWMYGTPFLFVVAVTRRAGTPYTPTHAEAEAFGATTDLLFTVALLANVALPALGLLLAKLTAEQGWTRYFQGALVAVPLLFLAFCLAQSMAPTPVVGHVPTDLETPSPVTACAHECPGG